MAPHRRDIDGLRALAVLPVVLFHAEVPGFSGGFVGVDVFFVISGFLITGILQRELAEGRYSLLGFYDRRIRRIFPALFVMLAAVTAAALVLLLPPALEAYGWSLSATSTFWSNLRFASEIGYFAANAAEKPLLHTWSLAVEEQFYIVWPVALWAFHRAGLRRWILPTAVVCFAASLALSIWMTAQTPETAFYASHVRAWELLVGAVLALRPPVIRSAQLRQGLAAAGLVLICGAVALFDHQTPFPGVAALAPCLGAGLLLATGGKDDTAAARLLSWRPLVFVGLVSYSFYLWHWPLLAFARYVLTAPPSPLLALGLVVLAFGLAALSWRFVEQPFRRTRTPGAVRRSLTAGLVLMAAGGAVGAALVVNKGLPGRVSPEVLSVQAFVDDVDRNEGECDLAGPGSSAVRPACRFGGATETYPILLWGDSHAEAFAPALQTAAAASGAGGAQMTMSACAPLVGVREVAKGEAFADKCQAFNQRVLGFISGHPEIRTLVIAARWSLYSETTWGRREPGQRWFLVEKPGDPLTVAHTQALFRKGVAQAVQEARRRGGPDLRIVLVAQAPEMPFNVTECLARSLHLGQPGGPCGSIPAEAAAERLRFSTQVLEEVAAADPNAEVVRLDEALCQEDRCWAVRSGRPLYRDYGHLTATAARQLAPVLRLRVEG